MDINLYLADAHTEYRIVLPCVVGTPPCHEPEIDGRVLCCNLRNKQIVYIFYTVGMRFFNILDRRIHGCKLFFLSEVRKRKDRTANDYQQGERHYDRHPLPC